MRRRFGGAGSAGAVAGLVLAAAAPAQEPPPLRFCVESVNLPMAMPHPDRGIEVELARALAGRLGRTAVLVWRAPGSESPDRAVLSGECDLAPGAVADSTTLARGGAVPGIALSRPYAAAGYLLVRHRNAPPARRLTDIGDERIGVEIESVPIYTLKQRGHRVHALDDYDAVIRAVAEGRISYGYLWGPLAAWLVRDREDVLLVDGFQTADRWSLSFALRAEDTALRVALDEAVAQMVETGAVARLFAKYGVPFLEPAPPAATATPAPS